MAEIGTAGSTIPVDQIKAPQDAITILCELSAEVLENVFVYEHTADCFCGQRNKWVEKGIWVNDGSTIQFIIDATRTAMNKHIENRRRAEHQR